MKRFVSRASLFALFFSLAVCNGWALQGAPASGRGSGKALIVYFSRVGTSKSFAGVDAVSSASLPKGNTIVIANMIRDIVGADMFQIVTVNSYPADYDETTDVALKEQHANARPKLSTHVPRMADYDTIFLGYPDWWGTLPMPVFSFLEEYDFSGKTIIPFCTHEGSGLGNSRSDIRRLCPKAKLLEGLAVRGSSNKGTYEGMNDPGASSWVSFVLQGIGLYGGPYCVGRRAMRL
jgi:flavodoxin